MSQCETKKVATTMAATIDHMTLFYPSGETQTNLRFLDVNQLVEGALKLMGQQIRDYGIELALDLAGGLPSKRRCLL